MTEGDASAQQAASETLDLALPPLSLRLQAFVTELVDVGDHKWLEGWVEMKDFDAKKALIVKVGAVVSVPDQTYRSRLHEHR